MSAGAQHAEPTTDQLGLLAETVTSLSKKHGQLKMATRAWCSSSCALSTPPSTPRRSAGGAGGQGRGDEGPRSEKAKKEEEKAAKKEKEEGKKESKEAVEARRRQEAQEEREREKVGAQNAKVLELMDAAKRIGDTGVTEETRMKIVELLRTVTEGKIFVEVERARITLLLSKMLYTKGKVSEAADALQELAVETFGSMDRREKVEFILEQMRLNYERSDLAKMAIVAKKINTKLFDNAKHADLKLRYYGMMIEYALCEDKFLDICKYYREVLATPSVQEDDARRKETLRNVVVFLALAKYDNEQSDLMARIEAMEDLDQVPEHKNLLKCFTTPELMRWPGIETLYGPMLRETATFNAGDSGGQVERRCRSGDGARWQPPMGAAAQARGGAQHPRHFALLHAHHARAPRAAARPLARPVRTGARRPRQRRHGVGQDGPSAWSGDV